MFNSLFSAHSIICSSQCEVHFQSCIQFLLKCNHMFNSIDSSLSIIYSIDCTVNQVFNSIEMHFQSWFNTLEGSLSIICSINVQFNMSSTINHAFNWILSELSIIWSIDCIFNHAFNPILGTAWIIGSIQKEMLYQFFNSIWSALSINA